MPNLQVSVNPSQSLAKALPPLAEFRFQLRSFLSFSESAAEAEGITAQQYQLLQVIEESSAAGTPITRIAERMLLRHNSAVELIDRAVRAKLVRRTTDPTDQRRALITLTPHGHSLLARLVSEHLAFLSRTGHTLIAALERVTS